MFESLGEGEHLVGMTEHQFRREFAIGLTALQLDADEVKPYSLRRGGATAHYQRFGQWERTQHLGR